MRAPVLAFLLAAAAIAAAAPASADCFRQCLSGSVTGAEPDDDVKEAARACRDSCVAEAKTALGSEGLLAAADGCRPEVLSRDDFRKVRSSSAAWFQSGVLVFQMRNPFPDRVLTQVDVAGQTMQLDDVGMSAKGLVPPSGEGSFVVTGFPDGYPGLRSVSRLEQVWACKVR